MIPSAALVGEKAVIGQGAEAAATAVARPPAIAGNRNLLIRAHVPVRACDHARKNWRGELRKLSDHHHPRRNLI